MAEPQPKDAGEKASAAAPAEPHRRPFAEFVVQTNRGITHARLTKALHDLIAAVTDTGKGGELVLKVKVAPLKKGATGQLEVSEQVTTKLPQTDAPISIFWADAEGNLTRSDPNQPVISGLEVVTPAPKEIPAR